MKNKGLFLFFTIVIALTCLYCISFSFVTWKIGKDAEKFANDPVAIEEALVNVTDPMLINHIRDSVINARTLQYLREKNDEKVFLGYTYKQAKYKEINLGLDLKGGMNVTLEVSYPDVLKSLAENTEDPLFESAFNNANEEYAKTTGGDYIGIFVNSFNAEKNARNMPNAQLRTYFGERYGVKNASDAEIIKFLRSESNEVIDRTFRILRTRIDRFGVAQPNLQRLPGSRILVELPGIKEPERVTELLKSTAKLEFWEVYNDPLNGKSLIDRFYEADRRLASDLKAKKELEAKKKAQTETIESDTTIASIFEENNVEEEIDGAILAHAAQGSDGVVFGFFKEADLKAVDQLIPEIIRLIGDKSLVLMWGKPERRTGNLYPLIPLKRNNDRNGPKLSSETIGGARVVKTARQDVNHDNQTVVNMHMETQAAEEWRKITKAAMDNKAKRTYIAVVLDNLVYSYPVIQAEIPNGESVISGQFTIDEAKDLATVLNSGNLEARVNIVQSEVVGPTLGKQSINSGLSSFAIAFLLVLLYMFLYYSKAGIVAGIALCTNIFFIMGVLASLGAVLTLPGIAGIVLTLTLAVDANVLIYERVREEVRAGKGARLAIDEGFKNAYPAIIDANVTSLITAVVLYVFGSGPIQGFATTLIIGILSSLFTAIFISRLIFENRLAKGISYQFGNKHTLHLFEKTNFDFIKNRKYFYWASIIACAIMLISFVTLGLKPGIDFTGGRNYVVRFDQDIKTNEVRSAITDVFGGSPEVKTFGGNNQVRITTNYKIESNDPKVDKEVEIMLYHALKGFFTKEDLTETAFTQHVDSARDLGIQSMQKVQPTIAKELLWQAIWAVTISLFLIFIYIAIRCKNWQFGLGGVLGLIHDALLTVGLYSLFYKVMPFSMEIDQSFIAAILTVIGFSINNVVIIYDRIRENLRLYSKRDFYTNINHAVNSTLGRTINTSASTIVVLLAIFLFGGEVIRGFIFAMFAGIIIGSYSGIFISPPLVFDLLRKAKKVNRQKVELLK